MLLVKKMEFRKMMLHTNAMPFCCLSHAIRLQAGKKLWYIFPQAPRNEAFLQSPSTFAACPVYYSLSQGSKL